MKHGRLARLQRLERQRRDERTRINTLEVYCDGELMEVLPIPYRLYELDDTGRRRFVEPDEDELAIEERARRLVANGRR